MNYPNNPTGDSLKRIKEDGSDMTKPMVFDFYLIFPNENKAETFALRCEHLGFKASVEFDEEFDEWSCICKKEIIPTYENVVQCEHQLEISASTFEGLLDGFGSYGNS